ncbi:MAG TPA: UDP-N-acetylmuramoyl-L-alanyl-D-glutamate--2,6-diaminopimelate ligase [Acidimicrobiales bacterium]|nr:UDP-N-acetylmuramoyl-L-alanyl-D-glutamate--2,6-diaminopimelate ligase [Acidimicrobiales bacterium]
MDRLLEEVEVVETLGDPAAVEIDSIAFDSRTTDPGALFCCVVGARRDGHDHAPEALARGAAALLVERPLPLEAVQAVVPPGTARHAMALAARALEGDPATALTTVAVTGTNGKTTVTHLLGAVFEAHGWPTTVIGTLDGARTTPEAPVLQHLLATARHEGGAAVAMEVSSHALTQGRVDGIRFDAAVFTNLSHDHLDYHRTMEAYFEAKAALFTPERCALAVVRADDPWGRRLLERVEVPAVGFSMTEVADVTDTAAGVAFTWRGRRVTLRLAGSLHVANALAAATTATALGIPDDEVVAGLEAAPPVRGRFELVVTDAPFATVVDYAHTPDGLAVALASARRLAAGHRVVCVFGCGGERDHDKRPVMGAVAAAGADVVVVTSDNPRGEDPRAIADDVLAGARPPGGGEVVVELDRGRAIALAVARAAPGDVVVVAGKGHEQVIERGDERVPFDDRDAVVAAARARAGSAPGAPR